MSAVARREGRGGDAVLGLVPRAVFEPSTVEEAAEAIRACDAEELCVTVVGGGTDLGIGGRPSAVGAVVRTGRLDRVVEHAPADQIAVVEAGVPLVALQERLAPHGQRLALDPPFPGRATVGGLVAANGFGPLRTRYGTTRDLLIGATLVRADGVVARGGGKVVKNVAGFDLPRLMVGSLGSLGLIATVTFRLHPLPEAAETVLLSGLDPEGLWRTVRGLREAQLEPSAVVALGAGPFDLAVTFEGFGPAVEAQRDRLAAAARKEGAACEVLDAAGAAGIRERHDAIRAADGLRLKVAALPSHFPGAVADASRVLGSAFRGPGFAGYPSVGVGFFTVPGPRAGDAGGGGPSAAAAEGARAVARTRELFERLGGSLVVQAAPEAVRAAVDPWGEPPAALALMKSLKERLDPRGRLAPGRHAGGI